MQSVDTMPHVPDRRDGELRSVKIVDDIFIVFTYLDVNLRLTELPKYVADGPDSMPSIRLYDGDLSVIMKLERIGPAVNLPERDTRSTRTCVQQQPWPPLPARSQYCQPVAVSSLSRNSNGASLEIGQTAGQSASSLFSSHRLLCYSRC